MKITVDECIKGLIDYAVEHGLANDLDRAYHVNRINELLGGATFDGPKVDLPRLSLVELLNAIDDIAEEKGVIPKESPYMRDQFDTAVMGLLTPRPSEVVERFGILYRESPQTATDWFYRLCVDCNYIRLDRIVKDIKWVHKSKYGNIEMTINLSKPEKDPKVIAALKNAAQSGYPKCALCHENEGFAGTLSQPARQNLRQIPLTLGGNRWYLQYSPYSYYDEHCIVLSGVHSPMKVARDLFDKALDFVDQFPHYFAGSNADLPIVGGSILSHEHMQGGRHCFAMDNARIEYELFFPEYPDVSAGILFWPLSVIRLRSPSKERLSSLAEHIFRSWQKYSDADSYIFADTDGEPHNTVTPIARRRNGDFELDIVLRNNITTAEHPDGLFHPHARYHNIKKENIGLIEVMGLAVLPSRLQNEMKAVEQAVVTGGDIPSDSPAEKHSEWLESFRDNYNFTADNVTAIVRDEIGKTFVNILENAGVFKCTDEGRRAFCRFAISAGAEIKEK